MKLIFISLYKDMQEYRRVQVQFLQQMIKSMSQLGFHHVLCIVNVDEKVLRYKIGKNEKWFSLRPISPTDIDFPMSKVGGLHSRTILVTQFHRPPLSLAANGKSLGVEGKTLDVFCRKFDMVYRLLNTDDDDFNLEDFIKFVYRSDLTMNSEFSIEDNVGVEMIHLNEWDGLCFLVPINIPHQVTSSPLEPALIFMFLLSIVLTVFAWKLISRSRFSFVFIVLTVFRIIIGQGVTREHLMNRKERLVVYSFLIGGTFIVSLYQSYVMSWLMRKPEMRSVKSFEELNSSNTKIFSYLEEAKVKFRSDLIVRVLPAIDKKSIFTLPDEFYNDMAYLVSCNYAESFVKSRRNINTKSNKRIFEKLPDRVSIVSMNYVVSRNFPLKEEMKVLVEALFESGIRGKWRKDFAEEKFNQTMNIEGSEESPLNMTDMRIPFIALSIGYIVSFAVFVIEFAVGQFLKFYRHISNLAHPFRP